MNRKRHGGQNSAESAARISHFLRLQHISTRLIHIQYTQYMITCHAYTRMFHTTAPPALPMIMILLCSTTEVPDPEKSGDDAETLSHELSQCA